MAARDIIGLLAAALFLNAALSMENLWPTLWVRPVAGLSIELAAFLLLIVLYVEVKGSMGRRIQRVITWLLVALVVGRYIDVTAHSLFGRSLNLYFDLWHLPHVAAMTAGALSRAEVVIFSLVAVTVVTLAGMAIRVSVLAIASAMQDRTLRWYVATLSVLCIAGYTVSVMSGRDQPLAWFAHPVSPEYVRQAGFLLDVLAGGSDTARFTESEPAASNLARLDGGDVYVIFLESYGAVAYDAAKVGDAVIHRAVELEAELAEAGWTMTSAYFTSPTFGGNSWLAHATMLAGIEISNNRDYELLFSTKRETMVGRFRDAGYRTVALMPGIKWAWPEGASYRFDKIYDAGEIDYRGPPCGWWEIPDQFSLQRLFEAEIGPRDRKPLFVVFPTIMSHMPFHPLPPYREDWSTQAFEEAEVCGRPETNDPTVPGGGLKGLYREAILYDLDLLKGFLWERTPADALVVVLGDHQPPGVVTGADIPWTVPVHLFSRKSEILDGFAEAGFRKGMLPEAQSRGTLSDLHRILLQGLNSGAGS